MKKILAGLVATGAVLGFATRPARAGTGEARKCQAPDWVQTFEVNRHNTSCKFGMAVAQRVTRGPISKTAPGGRGIIHVRGEKLYVTRPDGNSYYVSNSHREVSVRFWVMGG